MISFEFWHTEKRSIAKRLLLVWAVAGCIALALWQQAYLTHSLAVQAVYSFAISTCIWLLTDVLQLAFFFRGGEMVRSFTRLRLFLILLGCVIGYLIGTAIGDAFSGHSSWALLTHDANRYTRVVWLSALVSVGFIAYFYQQQRVASAERLMVESRLKLLESQLEPHMLFNTLANLRALIQTDSVKAVSMLDALNNYLRATLGASRTKTHPLDYEFARLNDYLALMAVRMGSRLRFTVDCPAQLAARPIAPLLLQPLVENAVKHGLEPAIAGGAIHIQAMRLPRQLVLSVSDTGLGGMAPGPVIASSGFGLNQVRERLLSCYGDKAQLAVVQRHGYATTFQITLPLDGAQ